jgi:hypothetical protein
VTKYLITVSTATRRGRTNLHTFGKLIEAEHLPWMPETHASRKQLKEPRRHGRHLVSVAIWCSVLAPAAASRARDIPVRRAA